MSNDKQHIEFSRLLDLAEDRLPQEQAEQAGAHLSGCAHCAAELAAVDQMLSLMRSDESVDAPSYVVARAARAFRPLVPEPTVPGHVSAEPLRRLVAMLHFDSAGSPLALGLRSEQPTERQLLFGAEDREIDLRITPTGGGCVVSGQVLGPVGGGAVELRGADAALVGALGPMQEFSLSPAPTGRYALTLRLEDVTVEVPELDLGD